MMSQAPLEHPTRWLLPMLLVSTAVLTAGTVAEAEPSKRQVQQFKHHVATGSKHYQNEEFERALEAFRKAQEIANPPSLRYNVARTLQSLGRCREAKSTLESFLSVDDLSEAKRRKGKKRLAELRDACPVRGTLAVDCGPDGADATVEVDGDSRLCPAEFELEPGSYSVAVSAPGYQSQTERVDIASDETTDRRITLPEAPKPDSGSDRSGGDGSTARLVAQLSGLAVGAGLLGGGVASDLGAHARLRNIREAADAGAAAEIQRLRRQAQSARTRTIALYTTGAAVALGSAVWMTIDLTSESQPEQKAALEVRFSPRSITGAIRW